jgi:uncharacterized membrane-anchored protein
VVLLLTDILLLFPDAILRIIGRQGAAILVSVMGIVLASLAVEIELKTVWGWHAGRPFLARVCLNASTLIAIWGESRRGLACQAIMPRNRELVFYRWVARQFHFTFFSVSDFRFLERCCVDSKV